ncbi:hydroquinone glucosyltransferase-like [Abrus precatorius]|uniref:Glycosyltransferase n=1 Tax=Abrus precatorius TaxID=3816 RepID=A0A8B8JV26_ABRPR|nr:hydroquinone glucosyltransferase-like [Abrus precatorius]
MAKTIRIAVVSPPAFSHQASIIEFCKKLVNVDQQFHVTCIFPTIDAPIPATTTLLQSLPSNVDYTFLTPVKNEDLPQGVPSVVQLQHAVCQSMPSFRNALRSLCSTTPLAALVADPFANEALEITKEFNILSYVYFCNSSMAVSFLLRLPTLHDQGLRECLDHLTRTIQIPGCIPIQGHDLPRDLRSSVAYEFMLQRCKRFTLADGFFVNSFFEMEQGTVTALKESSKGGNHNAPVYPVGPIIQTRPISEKNMLECMRWLEKQSPNSVFYVSFGSGGSLSQQQLNELALGLELSGQKFLWVLRPPNDVADGAYLVAAKDHDPLQFLPNGFLERIKEQGLIVPSWAPQIQILSHASTGGFLTHCGWNSILESILMGVPMVTWPLFAEQGMNAVLLTDDLKVALRPKFNENGIAEKGEISKVIKGLMMGAEGNEIRQRIEKLKDTATNALKEDGSSTRAIYEFGMQMENFQGRPLN